MKHSNHRDENELLGKIISGDAIFAFAQAERNSRFNLSCVETRASAKDGGWVLDGHKKVVVGAQCATHLIVTARTSGDIRDNDGISVFLVACDAPGVTLQSYTTYDGTLASDVSFTNAKLGSENFLGEEGKGLPLVERVVDEATAALCAEAVGDLDQLLNRTVEYSKERKQFGRENSGSSAPHGRNVHRS